MNRGRRIFKVLLVALIVATWAFVSVGCVHGIAAPEEEWNRTFGGTDEDGAYSAQQTKDGGYILAGYTWSFSAGFGDFWLVKTYSNGTEQWNKTYGGPQWEEADSVQQTSDGGYILAGYTSSYGAGSYDSWLVKTYPNGFKEWDKTYGGKNVDCASSVQQTKDNGYILAGGTESYGRGFEYFEDAWLIKTDSNGVEQWNRTFGGADWERVYSVRQTAEGGYVLAGGTRSSGAGSEDFWLIKTDSNGIELWNETFGGDGFDRAYVVQIATDNGYVLAGSTESNGACLSDAWLLKTDSNGNEQWNRTFGGLGSDRATSLQQTADGGYIFAGTTASYGQGKSDCWLLKTDSNGTEQWNRTFGGANWDSANSVQQTADSGFIVAGCTWSYSAGYDDIWLIKLKAEKQPPTAVVDSIVPNPAKHGKDIISFIGHGNDSDGSVVAYNWTSSIDGFLNTSSAFTKPASELLVGTHTIYFTVQDDYGAWSSPATEILTITTNQPPVASFSYSPMNPGINEIVTFNDSTSYDPDGSIVSYNWSFGDVNSTNTTVSTITHSYASVGEYTVNLTVTDDEGATNKTSRVIKVFPDVPYFDTEPGTYPSIPGTHNGTITMTHTVNVSKIYIYPCVGTGGHIKHAKIWNISWDGAEAHWNGYVDDWHNLPFDKNFTLVAGETYNYSIRTGSYPQIHHKHELLTAKGWITCEEFVDINGKRHAGWIPAIKLY
jgi:PKD repeat protein